MGFQRGPCPHQGSGGGLSGTRANCIAERDTVIDLAFGRCFIKTELTGPDLAGGPVDLVDSVQIGLRRSQKLIGSGLRIGQAGDHGKKEHSSAPKGGTTRSLTLHSAGSWLWPSPRHHPDDHDPSLSLTTRGVYGLALTSPLEKAVLPSQPPLIVFDLDGTLADTADDLIAALNHALVLEGAAPVARSAARHMVGLGARMLIARGLASQGRSISPERLVKLFQAFLAYDVGHIAVHSKVIPCVRAARDNRAALGFGFAVCTNKDEAASGNLRDTLGLADDFHVICGQDTFAFCKPDPRTLLATIAAAGGDPRTSIMVGDSRADIDTAKTAQVPVIAVDFGYAEQHVSTFGPEMVISHYDAFATAVALA